MTSLTQAAEIVDLAAITVRHLKELRGKTTDEQWDSFMDNPLLGELFMSVIDLECSIDEVN